MQAHGLGKKLQNYGRKEDKRSCGKSQRASEKRVVIRWREGTLLFHKFFVQLREVGQRAASSSPANQLLLVRWSVWEVARRYAMLLSTNFVRLFLTTGGACHFLQLFSEKTTCYCSVIEWRLCNCATGMPTERPLPVLQLYAGRQPQMYVAGRQRATGVYVANRFHLCDCHENDFEAVEQLLLLLLLAEHGGHHLA